MKKIALILILSAQAFTAMAQAAQGRTVVFCDLHNAAGQNGNVEVYTNEYGAQVIQINVLEQAVTHKEFSTQLGTSTTGVKVLVEGISLDVKPKSRSQGAYSANDSAVGTIEAAALGSGLQQVNCEYPRR